MQNDERITTIVSDINKVTNQYMEHVKSFNPCAITDQTVETIIQKSKELEFEYGKNFAFRASTYADNLRETAAMKNIKLTSKAISDIIDEHGIAIANWSVKDYATAIDKFIRDKSTADDKNN
jgi:hypothetical protein